MDRGMFGPQNGMIIERGGDHGGPSGLAWTIFGLHELDPRLITLGFTGVTASILMLARLRYANRLHAPVAARHA